MRSLPTAVVASSLLVSLALRGSPRATADDKPSSEIPKGVTADSLGKFKVTYYWITCEDDAKGERDTELQDKAGHSLGKFRAEFVKHLKVEGTGRTIEGKTLNATDVDGRFELVKTPWGLGAKGESLEPFRSIAVDPKVIPLGTKILIPEAAGALLPDGSIHDGIFVAADTGGAIKGQHIDLFCGLERDMKVIQKRGVDQVPIYKVTKDDRKPPAPVSLPHNAVARFAKVALWKGPALEGEPAGSLKEGETVKVVGREGAFWKLSDGKWVEGPALDLRVASPPEPNKKKPKDEPKKPDDAEVK